MSAVPSVGYTGSVLHTGDTDCEGVPGFEASEQLVEGRVLLSRLQVIPSDECAPLDNLRACGIIGRTLSGRRVVCSAQSTRCWGACATESYPVWVVPKGLLGSDV
jgi:hypothetical protein